MKQTERMTRLARAVDLARQQRRIVRQEASDEEHAQAVEFWRSRGCGEDELRQVSRFRGWALSKGKNHARTEKKTR